MSTDNANVLFLAGMLVVMVSALFAQRASLGNLVRSFLAWGVIAAVVWYAVSHRDTIESAVTIVAERLGVGEQRAEGDTVRITMSPDGHFWARVSLNGYTKRMLVDSGATITALSEATARNAGIELGSGGPPVVINTANGSVPAQRGTAERVTVDALETRDLGVVVSPAFGDTDVLGMNFLSRLGSWRVEGRTLVLEPKRSAAETREKGSAESDL